MNRRKYAFFILSAAVMYTVSIVSCGIKSDIDGKTEVISDASHSDFSFDENTEKPALYDVSTISQAYLDNDTSSLDVMQKEILDKATQIISQIITDDMNDYEKEIAVHDYIILNTAYDDGMLNALGSYSENSDNPYGTLINGKSICKGYTTTFQLFMDMLEIPCKIIYSKHDSEEHAWNMVSIDNEWYYVDVTWDDPTPDRGNRPVRHKYFNVTEELMAEKHTWNKEDLPKANSYKYSYVNRNLVQIQSYDEILPLMENALSDMKNSVELSFSDNMEISFEQIDKADDYYDIEIDHPEFESIFSEFYKKHNNYQIQCQRVQNGDDIVLQINMVKTSN